MITSFSLELYINLTLPEMYKRDRERLVHTFTHERGSLLAHIFGELK